MMESPLALPCSSSVSLPRDSARTPPPFRLLNHRSSAAAAPKPNPKLEPDNKSISYNCRSNFRPDASVASPPRPLTAAAELEFTSSNHLTNLNLYADIASNLAQDGKFQDFLTIVENIASSDFVRLLNAKRISIGIARMIEEGSVGTVVELLGSVQKLQIDPPLLLDAAASDALQKECHRIVEHGQVEEIVTLMETLQGYGLPIKEFMEPSKIIKLCVRKLNPGAAIRYKPDDRHLKQLIEEWCEGVIQNSHRKEGQRAYQNRISQGPESLLLEKVAENLQKSNALSVDLRELSKIEARLVVLAVLRMIKEAFNPGDVITDDLQIILGDDLHESGVKETVIKLLQHDLGLEVGSTGSKTETGRNYSKMVSANEASNTEKLHRDSSTRRPTVLLRLKISKESLHRWLQRNGCF